MAVLAESNVAARIPAQDLRRARSFYAGKLGLEPAGAAAGDHTQMAWEAGDLEEAIAELRGRGVIFEALPSFGRPVLIVWEPKIASCLPSTAGDSTTCFRTAASSK